MAYATVQDLVQRFGQTEMVRLTTPAGQDMDGVVMDVAERALADASAMADSYIRKRYLTPMDVPPDEVRRVALDIARYDLSTGDGKTVSEEVRGRYKEAIAWLGDIADGRVTLELDEVATGDESYAQVSTRDGVFGAGRW